MRLEQLRVFFETSPALRLLRSPNAPYILDFLHQQFKRGGQITVPLSELGAALAEYRERVQDTDAHALRDKPEAYLSDWCGSESRWLHRFLEAGRNEPIYQLTPHSEDVLAFLDRVLQQGTGFVATESRLRLVIETLTDLVVGATDDPEVRLAHLRDEQARVAQEIERIERERTAARYEPTRIRERFAIAIGLLKQLLGDFRAVEEKFKEITQQVQRRQNEGRDTRGGILGFALDSEDVLKREDQGVSFDEFVRFILSPEQQDRLEDIIRQLARLEELAEQTEGLETVSRMVPRLLAEAEKVMRTNQRLSATLRRLLDTRSHRERQRVSQLLREIKILAAQLAEDPPRQAIGLNVDVGIATSSPFARTFWSEPQRFAAVDLTEHAADDARRADAFRQLAQMQRLDWRALRSHVRDLVARHGSATLGRVLADHPPRAGVVELLGYLQIARNDGHLVCPDATEQIVLPAVRAGDRPLAVTLPLVTFVPTPVPAHA